MEEGRNGGRGSSRKYKAGQVVARRCYPSGQKSVSQGEISTNTARWLQRLIYSLRGFSSDMRALDGCVSCMLRNECYKIMSCASVSEPVKGEDVLR